MTEDELRMEDALAIHLTGFAAGRDYERKQIVRFLLQKHTIDQGTAWAAMEIKDGRFGK